MLEPQPMPVSARGAPALLWLDLFPFPFFAAGALEDVLLWPLTSKVCAQTTEPASSKRIKKIEVRLTTICDPCRKFQTLRLATRSDAQTPTTVGHESRSSAENLTGKVEAF